MQELHLYKEIDKICKPITQHLPIGLFSMIRFYPDGRRICISNSGTYISNFAVKYIDSVPQPELPTKSDSGIRIADVNGLIAMANSNFKTVFLKMVEQLERDFTTLVPFEILMAKPDYLDEFAFFPSNTHHSAYETLRSNYDVLRHFTFYFLDQASEIIRYAPRYKFINNQPPVCTVTSSNSLCIQAMKTKKYFLNTDTNTYLTKREAHCAHLITRNLSSREIAEIMSISGRTVEEYINNIKLKTEILHKSKLQDYLIRSGFDRMIEFENKGPSL